jgi:hypothetical protein
MVATSVAGTLIEPTAQHEPALLGRGPWQRTSLSGRWIRRFLVPSRPGIPQSLRTDSDGIAVAASRSGHRSDITYSMAAFAAPHEVLLISTRKSHRTLTWVTCLLSTSRHQTSTPACVTVRAAKSSLAKSMHEQSTSVPAAARAPWARLIVPIRVDKPPSPLSSRLVNFVRP